MSNATPPPDVPIPEVKYGGFTRFEIELEFVQSLGNPQYASHLATLSVPLLPTNQLDSSTTTEANHSQATTIPLLQHPPFIAYLAYLQYFKHPVYLKYLTYPGPTLKMLELLQIEKFRREIISPDVAGYLMQEGVRGMERWNGGEA